MGLIAGLRAVKGRIMGHAGALVTTHGNTNAAEKIDTLEAAGVVMVDHPSKFGASMKELLHIKNQASTTVSPDIIMIMTNSWLTH